VQIFVPQTLMNDRRKMYNKMTVQQLSDLMQNTVQFKTACFCTTESLLTPVRCMLCNSNTKIVAYVVVLVFSLATIYIM
jgi:phage-related protein